MRRLVFALALLFVAVPVLAQDPVAVDPGHHKVLLDNENVRVLRITFGPGEKSPAHDHPAAVAVFLADTDMVLTPVGGGAPMATPRKRGEAMLAAAVKHTVENKGTAGDLILVELKNPAGPWQELAKDSVKIDPTHYSVIGANDRVRVLRIRYGVGEKSIMHDHATNVAVFLTDGKGQFLLPDGKIIDAPFKSGDVMYGGAETHLPSNVGDAPFELVLVELNTTAPAMK